jgi:outer membrane protein OmpA-like peptidoglycan-associated protein
MRPAPGFRAAALAAPVLLALACASSPPPALVGAQESLARAEADPAVSRRAGVQLYEARQALERAQAEWDRSGDPTETEHLAGLASTRTEIARVYAEGEASVEEARSLARQRDGAVLELRTHEADLRAQEAEQARRMAAEAAASERRLREELAELQARETQRGLELTLGDVLFDLDQATLKPGAMQGLYRLATFLRDHPDRSLLVEGHTDATGSEGHNLELSQRRAESVTGFLAQNGVASARMLARGYGKAFPVAGNDTAEGRQLNRRVEVVILDPGESPSSYLR